MNKYIPGNQKHLTLNDRIYIENELAKGTPFKDIAAFLCKELLYSSLPLQKDQRLWEHPTFNDFYSFPNRVCLDIKAFTVTIRNLE